ncbi:MAG: isoprenylcysteine carboxylmethyltransferase family protein [Planctomycetota bacterium]|nr:isoprenylcysteine carboxylmethyltransferase family protein [Planctomycetota bacterium]
MPSRGQVRGLVAIVVYAAMIFGAAGTLAWIEGWIFFGWNLVVMTVTGIWLKRHDPVLYAERMKPMFQKGQPGWDRLILLLWVPAWLAFFIVPGLDAVRHGWSHVPLGWKIAGGVLHVVGWLGVVWTVKANTFLVPVVRVQEEREHRVIDTGPYALIRHPMYAAVFLWLLGVPLLLGSWWGLVPWGWSVIMLTVRTALEDRHLHTDLPGYREYAARVRYRLVPGVW